MYLQVDAYIHTDIHTPMYLLLISRIYLYLPHTYDDVTRAAAAAVNFVVTPRSPRSTATSLIIIARTETDTSIS